MTDRVRILIFAGLCALTVAAGAAFVYRASSPSSSTQLATPKKGREQARSLPTKEPVQQQSQSLSEPPTPVRHPAIPTAAQILYRNTNLGPQYGFLMSRKLGETVGLRHSDLRCERVHFSSGYGICLTADRGFFTAYAAEIFDATGRRLHSLSLPGPPSRTRVAPNGRVAAITVFVSGHSYAQAGFSTQTTLVETASGHQLGELEQFLVTKEGVPFKRQDFNFWGVTFTQDSKHFYATLGTGGRIHLVRGDIASQQMTVIQEGIECPSLSPDNKRIAFKTRLPGPVLRWRLAILDLATSKTRELNETRHVDDQVEWLNNNTILYSLPESETVSSARTDVWKLPVDEGSAPELLIEQAYSPTVISSAPSVAATTR